MAAVKARGNASTELRLIKLLRAGKISGWRRDVKVLGRPDIAFPKQRIAIFVDGCFWHGCKKHRGIPVQNREFWTSKIERNTSRDKQVGRGLKKLNWQIIRIWEHDLNGKKDTHILKRLKDKLKEN